MPAKNTPKQNRGRRLIIRLNTAELRLRAALNRQDSCTYDELAAMADELAEAIRANRKYWGTLLGD